MNAIKVTIREATVEDAAGIARVHVETWRSTYRGLLPDSVLDGLSIEGRTQHWTELLSRPTSGSFACVAEAGGEQVVGFALAGPEREDNPDYLGETYAIYILSSFQGQGIGRRMISAIARRFVDEKLTTMLVWVLKENYPAREFYEAIGGKMLKEKPIEIARALYTEVAYGWDDISRLAES